MTDVGPVRLLAVDESGRKTAWDNGEAVVSSPVAGPPVNWMLLEVKPRVVEMGRLKLFYVVIPMAKTLEHQREAWTDFENALETLARIQ